MGINISCKTKAKASLKLYSQISTYLFEQELNELKGYPRVQKAIVEARKALFELIKKEQ